MTDTLPDIAASYSSAVKTNFRTKSAQFGDGYTQRAADGLNSVARTWSLSWQSRPIADIDSLYDFLIAKLGAEAFYWTAPGDTQRKWICQKDMQRTPVSAEASGYDTLKVTFQEVFDI